jgi:hypothetical protein
MPKLGENGNTSRRKGSNKAKDRFERNGKMSAKHIRTRQAAISAGSGAKG